MIRPFALVLLAAIALAGCTTPGGTGPAGSGSDVITLAIQPTDNADVIQSKAPEMEAFLEERLKAYGVEADVKIYVPTSSIGVVEALRFGHADAAMMSAWPMAIAQAKADAHVVLAEQREVIHGETPTVAPYYYSYYVVPKDSPYQTLADLQGKTVAYASATSTSGYIFPVAKLVQEGLIPAPAPGKEADPKAFFGNAIFAGGYAQAWEALKNGQVDVTVTAGDISAALYHEVLANTRVIATQGPIPSHGVVFSSDFHGTPEADALQKAFLDLKGDKKDLMRKLVSGIFVEFAPTTTEEHIEGLRDALNLTGLRFSEKI